MEEAAPNSYCAAIRAGQTHEVHVAYHDTEYGFPQDDDSVLFERLVLEINQAGLSWETILKKRAGFQSAYEGFRVESVAAYSEADRSRLLNDSGIIRNRLKVNAAMHNASVILRLQEEHGSFHAWLESHKRLEKPEWIKLFKRTFVFTGGEIVGEFLMSLGYLPGAHDGLCAVGRQIRETYELPWNHD